MGLDRQLAEVQAESRRSDRSAGPDAGRDELFEDASENCWRNPWPFVADPHGRIAVAVDRHLDGPVAGAELERVGHHVLDDAAVELFVPVAPLLRPGDLDGAREGESLKLGDRCACNGEQVAAAARHWEEGRLEPADLEQVLVEDNPKDVLLTERAFKQSKIANELHVAHDGAEALDYLLGPEAGTTARPWPALVLLDLKLPKVDGLEVLRRIRADERTRLLPVVILTSSNEEQDIIRGYADGANSYIRKPVDFTQFTEAVANLGLYWLVLNEPPPVSR